VQEPQPEFEDFLKHAGRALGRRASIRAITSTHLTFLESRDAKKVMRESRVNSEEAKRFSFWMSNQLDQYRTQHIDVTIDEQRPLKIMGQRQDMLVLNIIEDEQIIAERNRTESLLQEEFGELPKLKGFEPHISIGYIGTKTLSPIELRRPETLLPRGIIPETIALNGLTVFLDGKGLKH
jgi:hypothetical protein